MIYMDEPRPVTFRHFKRTSHLMSTLLGSEGTVELDAFAKRIGLKPAWRQSTAHPTEHYDLFDGAIERAVRAGAIVVTGRELIRLCVKPKRAAAKSQETP